MCLLGKLSCARARAHARPTHLPNLLLLHASQSLWQLRELIVCHIEHCKELGQANFLWQRLEPVAAQAQRLQPRQLCKVQRHLLQSIAVCQQRGEGGEHGQGPQACQAVVADIHHLQLLERGQGGGQRSEAVALRLKVL